MYQNPTMTYTDNKHKILENILSFYFVSNTMFPSIVYNQAGRCRFCAPYDVTPTSYMTSSLYDDVTLILFSHSLIHPPLKCVFQDSTYHNCGCVCIQKFIQIYISFFMNHRENHLGYNKKALQNMSGTYTWIC